MSQINTSRLLRTHKKYSIVTRLSQTLKYKNYYHAINLNEYFIRFKNIFSNEMHAIFYLSKLKFFKLRHRQRQWVLQHVPLILRLIN